MKKILLAGVLLLSCAAIAKADVEFAYEAGAEVVSAYIWRGQYNGGLSFQPEALVGFNAKDEALQFRAGAWASLGASDWKFKKNGVVIEDVYDPNTRFMPEVDFMASFYAYGASVGFNEYYYCDDGSSHTSEIWVGFNFDHLFGQSAYINWYTTIAGADEVLETDLDKLAKGKLTRQAFSSYLELGYDYTFEDLGLTIGAQLGISPWASPLYGNEKFAVTNISARIEKEWDLDVCSLSLFAQGSINPDVSNIPAGEKYKDYVYIDAAGDDKLYLQKLNGCIGIGVWF